MKCIVIISVDLYHSKIISNKLCIYCVYRIQYITQPCQLHSTLWFMAHTGYLGVHSFIIPSVRTSLVFSLHPSFPQTCASVSGQGICWAFCLLTNSPVFVPFLLLLFFKSFINPLWFSACVCLCISCYLCVFWCHHLPLHRGLCTMEPCVWRLLVRISTHSSCRVVPCFFVAASHKAKT